MRISPQLNTDRTAEPRSFSGRRKRPDCGPHCTAKLPARRVSLDLHFLQMRSSAQELLNGFWQIKHTRTFGSLPGNLCVSLAMLVTYGVRFEDTARPTIVHQGSMSANAPLRSGLHPGMDTVRRPDFVIG